MRQLPRIHVARLGGIPDLAPTAAVVAMLGAAALVDEVLLPNRNVAIIFLIPMLVAVLISSTWLAALAAVLAILDYWMNVSRGERPMAISELIVILVVGALGVLLARQRRESAALYRVAEDEACALREAEQANRRLAAIVESSDDAVYSVSLDGTILSWNRGAERIFGYTAAEIVGCPVCLVPPERADEIPRVLVRIARGEVIERFRTMRIRKDGTRIPVSLTVSPIRAPNGEIIAFAVVLRDASDEVAAHESLERQVADRTRELTNLLAASHALASTLDLNALLRLILDHLNRIIDCTTTHLFSRVGEELVLVDYRGPPPPAPPAPIALGRAEVRETLVDHAEPIVVEDILGQGEAARRFRRAFGERSASEGVGGRSRMWIPLLVRGEVVGGLCVSNAAPGYFTARHEALAKAFASQAATALQNAKLYEEAQRLAAVHERQRLAKELHDAVTQTLFATSLIAEVLPRLWEQDPDEGRRSLQDLWHLTRGALAEMRALLAELQPERTAALPLGQVVRQLAEAMASRAQARLTYAADDELPVLPAPVHTALYRIAQEALNNVTRHARASQITVHVRGGPRAVELVIRDDGRGFDPAGVPDGHLGLAIMRERAASIGATLSIESQAGQGTQVRGVWPTSPDT
jgi:PAS domain S-box-containing protein